MSTSSSALDLLVFLIVSLDDTLLVKEHPFINTIIRQKFMRVSRASSAAVYILPGVEN